MPKRPKDPDLVLIDEDDIEQEWANHPANVNKHTRLLADARHQLDEAKANLELLAARIELTVRKRPAKFGLPDEPREGSIRATVKCDPQYLAAVAKVRKARYELDVIKGALKTLDNKKRSMEYLMECRYHERNSEPRFRSGGDREAAEEDRKRFVRAAVSKPKIR